MRALDILIPDLRAVHEGKETRAPGHVGTLDIVPALVRLVGNYVGYKVPSGMAREERLADFLKWWEGNKDNVVFTPQSWDSYGEPPFWALSFF